MKRLSRWPTTLSLSCTVDILLKQLHLHCRWSFRCGWHNTCSPLLSGPRRIRRSSSTASFESSVFLWQLRSTSAVMSDRIHWWPCMGTRHAHVRIHRIARHTRIDDGASRCQQFFTRYASWQINEEHQPLISYIIHSYHTSTSCETSRSRDKLKTCKFSKISCIAKHVLLNGPPFQISTGCWKFEGILRAKVWYIIRICSVERVAS